MDKIFKQILEQPVILQLVLTEMNSHQNSKKKKIINKSVSYYLFES